MNPLSQSEVSLIKDYLNLGMSCKDISIKMNLSLPTVYKYKNTDFIKSKRRNIITQEVKDQIVIVYKQTYSIYKTAKILNISSSFVYKFLHKENKDLLKRNHFSSIKKPRRKYPCDENFFDKIDTEAKSYLLGFLYADGYNSETEDTIKLGIGQEDISVLDYFSNKIEMERPYEKCKGQVIRLNIHSTHMSKQLVKWGCGQAKTFKLKYPEFLSEDLQRHFIRGYFDGDGCMYLLKQQSTGRLSFTGYIPFLESINIHLNKKVNTTVRNIYPINGDRGTGSLEYTSKKDIEKIHTYMYQDCEFKLDRKYKKVNQIVTSKPKRKQVDNASIIDTYIKLQSVSKVANQLELSVMTVYNRLLKYKPELLVRNKFIQYAKY